MKTRRASTKRTRSKKSRSSRSSGPVSLPQLRAGLHHLHGYGQSALKRASSLRQAATDFAKEWQAVFGKKIPVKSAMDYLKHSTTYNGKTKKKQRGGVADVGYTMRAGASAPYGAWPKYVSGGFTNAEPSMGCGAAAKQTGGNILGDIGDAIGKFATTTGQIFYQPTSTVPTTLTRDLVTGYKGQPVGPIPDPTSKSYQYISSPEIQNMADLIAKGQTRNFQSMSR